jgi:hypothetical protein
VASHGPGGAGRQHRLGLLIWWLGEGLGGVFTSAASPITGAPGGALLSALIAVLAWPSRRAMDGGSVAAGSPLGGQWARVAWLALWGSGAYFLLLAANRAAGALRATIIGGVGGEPSWIGSIERSAGSLIGTHSTAVTIGLAVLFVIIALGVFVSAAIRPVLILALIIAAAIWVLGQSFGEIATGQATDPNTGPLLILLAAAYWPARAHAPRVTGIAGRGRGGSGQPSFLTGAAVPWSPRPGRGEQRSEQISAS